MKRRDEEKRALFDQIPVPEVRSGRDAYNKQRRDANAARRREREAAQGRELTEHRIQAVNRYGAPCQACDNAAERQAPGVHPEGAGELAVPAAREPGVCRWVGSQVIPGENPIGEIVAKMRRPNA